jgi:hypothetical protein
MAKHVFILGAGASVEAGGPLMWDFLDRSEDLLRAGRSIDLEAFHAVFEAIAALQTVHSKATFDIQNVESIFAAFEMARLFGRLGEVPETTVRGLPSYVAKVIVQTVEALVMFRWKGYRVEPPGSYSDFVRLLLDDRYHGEAGLQKNRIRSETAIITFNYDLGLDHALGYHRIPISYSLQGKADPQRLPLLKLHGSLNWHRPKASQEDLAVEDVSVFVEKARIVAADNGVPDGTDLPVPVSPYIPSGNETFIVPPTWSKMGHYEAIAPVWSRAAEAMAEAENIFVFGFSLPPTDQFFRLLYGLGTVGKTRLRRFWVFDPADSVSIRFEGLLGPAARERFKFFKQTFNQGVLALQSEIFRELY